MRAVSWIILCFVCNLPSSAVAAGWHSLGVCSYLQDESGDQAFRLVSQSPCRQDFYVGTGFWFSIFVWENGNSVQLVSNFDEETGETLRINDVRVLSTGPLSSQGAEAWELGTCHLSKAPRGFEATCFRRIGPQVPGH